MDLVKEMCDIINSVSIGDIYRIIDAEDDRKRAIGIEVRVINISDKASLPCQHKEFCSKTNKFSCIEFVNTNNKYDTMWNCYYRGELIRRVND